jgi:uncharacterized membrane protein
MTREMGVIRAGCYLAVSSDGVSLVMYGLTHATALTFSIFFAVWPKAATSFARPSLFRLPWKSYIVFGLAAYVLCVLAFWILFQAIAVPVNMLSHRYPAVSSAIICIPFALYAVVLSILLDLRLWDRFTPSRRSRIGDAIRLTGAIGIAIGIILILFPLIQQALLNRVNPVTTSPVLMYSFLVGELCIAFIIGYLTPSTAEAYLDANKIANRLSSMSANQGRLFDKEM